MNEKEFQELLTSRLREMLDPIVVEAGYSPNDYKIVWKPIEPLDVQSFSITDRV